MAFKSDKAGLCLHWLSLFPSHRRLTLPEVFHYEIMLPDFIPPSNPGGIGHVNFNQIPSMADSLNEPFWGVNHWDSLYASRASLGATLDAIIDVGKGFLGELEFGFSIFSQDDDSFYNGYQYFSMRKGRTWDALLQPSGSQTEACCVWIGYFRLLHGAMRLPIPIEVAWWERHGLELLAELGAIFAQNELAGYPYRLHVPNVTLAHVAGMLFLLAMSL